MEIEPRKRNRVFELILGVLMIVLSVFFLSHPANAIISVYMYIAIIMLFRGATNIGMFFVAKELPHRGMILASGIVDILFGLMMFNKPLVGVISVSYLAGFWVMFSGIMAIVMSLEIKKSGAGNWWLSLIMGILAIFASLFVFNNPLATLISITAVIGVYLIIEGVIRIFSAFKG